MVHPSTATGRERVDAERLCAGIEPVIAPHAAPRH
jgi:hypothetical protein